MPCVSSPCSPRLSPWSAVTSTSGGARARRSSSALQQARELGVDEGDLAVVGRRRAGASRARRAARRARAGRSSGPRGRRAASAAPGAAQPAQGGVGGRVGGALDVGGAPRVVAARQVVVVGVEAAVEAEAAVEREARDEGRGAVAGLLEVLGRASARVGGSTKAPLSRTPWPSGVRPVRIEACDGAVSGACATAVAKRTPRAASASSVGVARRVRRSSRGGRRAACRS